MNAFLVSSLVAVSLGLSTWAIGAEPSQPKGKSRIDGAADARVGDLRRDGTRVEGSPNSRALNAEKERKAAEAAREAARASHGAERVTEPPRL